MSAANDKNNLGVQDLQTQETDAYKLSPISGREEKHFSRQADA